MGIRIIVSVCCMMLSWHAVQPYHLDDLDASTSESEHTCFCDVDTDVLPPNSGSNGIQQEKLLATNTAFSVQTSAPAQIVSLVPASTREAKRRVVMTPIRMKSILLC